jgi:hypothetical protein
MKKPEPITNAIGGQPVAGMIFSAKSPDSETWGKALVEGDKEQPIDLQKLKSPHVVPELVPDKQAIHRELRAARMRRTVRIRPSLLP